MDELQPVPRKPRNEPSIVTDRTTKASASSSGDVRIQTLNRFELGRFVPDYEYRYRHYLLRFAKCADDVEQLCRLRYDVFNLELGEGLESSVATGIDRDEYDEQCEHLMVIDTRNDEVVGTYRLQVRESADAGHGFYSATEFDFGVLPSEMLDGTVELGRACTARRHRSRTVLDMLWRGIMTYLHHNRRRYLLGCSSLTSQDPALGLATYQRLIELGHQHPTLLVNPMPDFACQVSGPCTTAVKIPRLFTLYLRLGVRVCGPPALDREFGTIDFLTLLDTQTVDQTVLGNLTS
ncbi:MAG: putative hemolysin [Planctomycetota bacterium]|jgi:putative hemolysin